MGFEVLWTSLDMINLGRDLRPVETCSGKETRSQSRGQYSTGCSDLLDLMSYYVCFMGTSKR